jgi:speckle-type POZ protein
LFFVKWEKKKILSISSNLKTHGAGISTEWSGMAKREALGRMARLGGGSVAIRCDVTVFNAFRAEAAAPKSKKVPVPPSELQKNLSVLSARSPVISAELLGAGSREGGAAAAAPVGIMRVGGVEARVFRALLRFAYTDALPEVGKRGELGAHLDGVFRPNQAHGVQHPAFGCLQQP